MSARERAAMVAVVSALAIPRVVGVESVNAGPCGGNRLLLGGFGGQLVADRVEVDHGGRPGCL